MTKTNQSKNKSTRKYEDKLLEKYANENGGLFYTEVRVGQGGGHQYPKGAKSRRIDAIRLQGVERKITPFLKIGIPEFIDKTRGRTIEVIEIKRELNRIAIGQVIVAGILMKYEYRKIKKVKLVILYESCDPVLELVCRKMNIEIWPPK